MSDFLQFQKGSRVGVYVTNDKEIAASSARYVNIVDGTSVDNEGGFNYYLKNDFQIAYNVLFSSVVDKVPAIKSLNFFVQAGTALLGNLGEQVGVDVDSQSLSKTLTHEGFGFQMYTGVEPFSMRLALQVFAREDAVDDVLIPALALMNYTLPYIANKDSGDTYFSLNAPKSAHIGAVVDLLRSSESPDDRKGLAVVVKIGEYLFGPVVVDYLFWTVGKEMVRVSQGREISVAGSRWKVRGGTVVPYSLEMSVSFTSRALPTLNRFNQETMRLGRIQQ